MNLIPRKEVVEENASVSRVIDVPGGASRMTSVIVEEYASIVVKKYAGAEEFTIAEFKFTYWEVYKYTHKISRIYKIPQQFFEINTDFLKFVRGN
jgi:hypothetical protein